MQIDTKGMVAFAIVDPAQLAQMACADAEDGAIVIGGVLIPPADQNPDKSGGLRCTIGASWTAPSWTERAKAAEMLAFRAIVPLMCNQPGRAWTGENLRPIGAVEARRRQEVAT